MFSHFNNVTLPYSIRSDAEVEIVEDEEDLCSINIQSTVEQQVMNFAVFTCLDFEHRK